MKKQIFFFLLLAFFAGNYAFGQAIHVADPIPVTCSDDPEHPIAGRSYTYEASALPAGGNFTFWATKNTSFISTAAGVTTLNTAAALTTPTDLIATSGNYATAAAQGTVDITWSDAILNGTDPATSPTFVAAYYAAPATACADNFRAWMIQPIKAFTVDIRNIDNANPTNPSLAYGTTDEQCFDGVKSATWTGAAIDYDFGTQVLYYEVVAANFTNYFIPTFTLTGLNAVQTATIEWDYTPNFTAPHAVSSGVASPDQANVDPSVTSTANGVSIFVRVTITNANFEGAGDETITLAVDAQNSVGDWDVVNATCVDPLAADLADTADQVLKLRPTITPVAPATFVPVNVQN